MKHQLSKAGKLLILTNALRSVVDLFLGPFLIAFFMVSLNDSLVALSWYQIISYFVLGIASVLISVFLKNANKKIGLGIGIFITIVYLFIIIILGSNINIPGFAILFGLSAAFYWMPYNVFVSSVIKAKERKHFFSLSALIRNIFRMIAPFLLGLLITLISYQLTALIIILLCVIQLIAISKIKYEEQEHVKLDIKSFINTLMQNNTAKKIFTFDIFSGLTRDATTIVMTILIVDAFITDFNLGFWNSIFGIATVLTYYIFIKLIKQKHHTKIILINIVFITLNGLMIFFEISPVTIIIYNLSYATIINLTFLMQEIMLNTVVNEPTMKKYRTEYFMVREIILNTFRIVSFFIVLYFITLDNIQAMNILLVVLTIGIIIQNVLIYSVEKEVKINEENASS